MDKIYKVDVSIDCDCVIVISLQNIINYFLSATHCSPTCLDTKLDIIAGVFIEH